MRSSISSSSARDEGAKWARSWISALLITAAILGGLEAFWRYVGHPPSVLSDKELWAYYRTQVYRSSPPAVVTLGASRMQLDVSSEVFHEMAPNYRLVRLGVQGTPPMATLLDLSNDKRFDGVVLCSIVEDSLERRNREKQEDYVENYRRRSSLNGRVNARWIAALQSKIVLLNPNLTLRSVFSHLITHRQLPGVEYVRTLTDRSRIGDFTKTDAVKRQQHFLELIQGEISSHPPPSPQEWLAEALEVEPMVRRIQSRGGKVAFLRLPTSGEIKTVVDEAYPRSEYWDRFAEKTSALVLRSDDYPELSKYDCPDGSHLNYEDAVPFTRSLLDILFRRGFLKRPDRTPGGPVPDRGARSAL